MTSLIQIAAGALCVAAVFVDAFLTTITVSSGAGPLTEKVLAWAWALLLRLHREDKRSSILTAGGTLVLTVTVLVWVAILWAGWGLVFLGSGSIVDSTTQLPASVGDVFYYAGFTVFTLGTGDYVAGSSGWRLATAAASFSGLFLVTLAITYLISVVSAVVQRRALAIQIRGLGRTPDDVVLQAWQGDRFSSMFEQQLVSLTGAVATSAEQHLAYPVLHYFHARSPFLSAPLAVASLNDVLLLASEGVAPEGRPDPNAVRPLAYAITRYVDASSDIGSLPSSPEPPAPERSRLAAADVPLTDGEHWRRALKEQHEQRVHLHRLVNSDGWSWSPGLEERTG